MKRLVVIVLVSVTSACVPPGYVKDPAKEPVTQEEFRQFKNSIGLVLQQMATSFEQRLKAYERNQAVPQLPVKVNNDAKGTDGDKTNASK